MSYSTDVEAARALAARVHTGQTDKAGEPYITHPQRVAAPLESSESQVVAWLHDTVEDTTLTLDEIRAQFGAETAAAVDAITRRAGEAWGTYLERVKENPVAKAVKISDLIDNSNLGRLPKVTMEDVDRQARYNKALKYLMAENITQRAVIVRAMAELSEMAAEADLRAYDERQYIRCEAIRSKNDYLLTVEVNKSDPPKRVLSVGVIRRGTERLLSSFLLFGTQEEIVNYLAYEGNADSVLEKLQQLAVKVDDYYNG